MPEAAQARSYGKAFNQVAVEYDRHRPAYPDELIDLACEIAGTGAGDRVLEIGCGTGQLTRALLARGLRVTAVEPGDRLLALARQNLDGLGEVQFVSARLEDAPLSPGGFQAVFSASAFHWIDPDVSWRRVAEALVPGGVLALVSYFGLKDARSAGDQRALRAEIDRIAPELAADWPAYRDLEGTIAGARARADNVSKLWSWLGSYDLARRYAADLFDDVRLTALPNLVEHTADELTALLGTMSFWSRLSAPQREQFRRGNRALYESLGRPIRSSTCACLVTARRARRARRLDGSIATGSTAVSAAGSAAGSAA